MFTSFSYVILFKTGKHVTISHTTYKVLEICFSKDASHMVEGKKVSAKLSLCLTKHHTMKTHWGVEVWPHALLTSALHRSEWSVFTPRPLYPRGKESPVLIRQEAGWAPEQVWKWW
jgi:hypothetical protein